MTLVGDIAQTGALGGTSSWDDVLSPYVGQRWKLAELTVNYRTPAEIMAVAADVLSDMDTPVEPPSSVRSSGHPPWHERVAEADLPRRLPELIAGELDVVGDGRTAVLLPPERLAELGEHVTTQTPNATIGNQPEGLDSPAVLLTVEQTKGLEFDSVLVVDPEGVLRESERGYNDLYVALTRATQRLGVVHTGALPPVLKGLEE